MKFEDIKDSFRYMHRYLEEIKPRGKQVTWDIGTYLANANTKAYKDVVINNNISSAKAIDNLINKIQPPRQ